MRRECRAREQGADEVRRMAEIAIVIGVQAVVMGTVAGLNYSNTSGAGPRATWGAAVGTVRCRGTLGVCGSSRNTKSIPGRSPSDSFSVPPRVCVTQQGPAAWGCRWRGCWGQKFA